MSLDTKLKLWENRTIVQQSAFNGSSSEEFYVLSGSRMLISLKVTAIDPATTVTLNVGNNFEAGSSYDVIETLSAGGVGTIRRVISDFNNVFSLGYTVSGGSATFKVAVALFDNALTTRIDNAIVDVDLSHTIDTQGNFDSVRIGDGTDLLQINSDGSINVVVIPPTDEVTVSLYNEVMSVLASTETDVLTYTVPVGKTAFINRCEVSGENIAAYDLVVNTDVIGRKRTYFGGNLNETFEFSTNAIQPGLKLQAGDIVKVKVTHERPASGNFEARLQVLEKG